MSAFEFIRTHLDIFDTVSKYVPLKRIGNYWKSSCPFHKETDASFTISPDKQIFYCFGCQASGDAVAFIARIENLSQGEALQFLAEQHSIELPDNLEFGKSTTQKGNLTAARYFLLCKLVANWAHEAIGTSSAAQKYLKERQVTQESIAQFEIGIFPGTKLSLQSLIKIVQTKGFLVEDLLEVGILVSSGRKLSSPFDKRVVFPIRDGMGRYVGFGGRVFLDGDTRPKYYNTKESDYFLKRKLVFGLDLAKEAQKESKIGYLVEGYLDCIAMSQHGYTETIATLGTACTIEHLKILARTISTLYVIYDADKAGKEAVLRVAKLCWEANLELKVTILGQDDDPAALLARGESLDPFLEKSHYIFDFFITSIGQKFRQANLADKLNLSKKMIDVITEIDDPIKRDLLFQNAARELSIPLSSLRKLTTQKSSFSQLESSLESNQPKTNQSLTLEQQVFILFLIRIEQGEPTATLDPKLFTYALPSLQALFKTSQELDLPASGKAGVDALLNGLDSSAKTSLAQFMIQHEADASASRFNYLLERLTKRTWKQIMVRAKKALNIAMQEGNTAKVKEIMETVETMKKNIQ